MKKIIIIAAALLALSASGLKAQGPQALPCDPEVKTGTLSNGMTYYIRHNDKPAQRAEFYLATHVGAIQEGPGQDGLAHFLEHMCFNGLKNLPGKQMLDYLQHIGAEFGRNINASTGVEQTLYMLNNIPVVREGVVDTCLLVMHDYSHFVLNEPKEIDSERGVILEEKRTRNTAGWRMFEKTAPYLYGKSSKYATCNIIGSEETLKTFKPETIVDYYQTWYRPDMQALIVIGDIDVDQIYDKIVKLFADIPAPESPTVKIMPEVEMNDKPEVGIITDPENTSEGIMMLLKLGEPLPKEIEATAMGYSLGIVKDLIESVMSERFHDICSKPDAPILGAEAGVMEFCETMEGFVGQVVAKQGHTMEAADLLFTEIEKLRRYGVSESELERAKEKLQKSIDNKVEKASSRKNPEFVFPIVNHFFKGKPYLVPETEQMLCKSFLAQLHADSINQVIGQILAGQNPVIIFQGIDKPGIEVPTEDQLLASYVNSKTADIQANAAEEIDSDFMANHPVKAGKVKKAAAGNYESTVWTLKNGLNVVVLHTDYNKNEVKFELVKQGGKSLIPENDVYSFEDNVMTVFDSNTGIAEFPSSTVSKMLSGKTLSVNSFIGNYSHGFKGSCAPADLETAMQILNLVFTAPRFDQDEWNVGISQIGTILPNLITTSDYKNEDHVRKAMYADSPRTNIISPESLAKANLNTYEKYYRQLFSDVAGATLYIVGNVTPESVKPLVEKYCGSLPKGKKASVCNLEQLPKWNEGVVSDEFAAKMETPKVTVTQVCHALTPFSMQKKLAAEAAGFILDMIYVETLREEEGGTYGAGVGVSVSYYPVQRARVYVGFDTNVDQQKKLRELAVSGLKKLAEEGPTEEQMTRAIENARKNLPENRIKNSYWMEALKYDGITGGNYDKEYGEAVANLKAEDVKSLMSEILASGNFIEVVMTPAAE